MSVAQHYKANGLWALIGILVVLIGAVLASAFLFPTAGLYVLVVAVFLIWAAIRFVP
jgi:hypothetical protein